jgi:hypothetical protein
MPSSDSSTMYQIFTDNLNSIGRACLIGLGTVGAVINLCVFARRTMRRNPFSIYMIAFNIANLCYIWLSLFPLFIDQVFQVNPTIFNLTYCRFYYYLSYTLSMLSPSYLILASIDRVLVSSRNALTRQKSTCRLAFWLISGVTFTWFLFYCQFWFRINMQSFGNSIFLCYFDLGIYALFINYSGIILNGLLPPVLMSICALKTLKNIRGNRIGSILPEHPTIRITPKNRQLIIMLLVEIFVYIVFSLIQPIFLSYIIGSSSIAKTGQQQILENFVLSIANFFSYVPCCVSFFCNIVCSNKFRKQVKEILHIVNPPCSRQQVTGSQEIAMRNTGRPQRDIVGNEQRRTNVKVTTIQV